MAAGHVFLTQVSSRAWKCSECPLVFTADDAAELDRMLRRFMHHVRKSHDRSESGGAPKWRPRRRRRSSPEEPERPETM